MKPSAKILKLYNAHRREIDECRKEYKHSDLEGSNGIRYHYILERFTERICTGGKLSEEEAWLSLIGKVE